MVFVDNMRRKYGRMIMCHMIADTSEELLGMAQRIGVAKKWLQAAGTYQEHFDICLEKRTAAIGLGAQEISSKELVRRLRAKKV